MKALNSIKCFNERLIDYAGLFPPASLDLQTSYSNYIKYKQSEYAWMLSRFICPVKLLPALETIINQNLSEKFSVSVITTAAKLESDFKNNFINDFNICNSFIKKNGNFKIDMVETKLPDGDKISYSDCVSFAVSSLQKEFSDPAFIFFEGNSGENWKQSSDAIINSISTMNEQNLNSGFKLRTGGTSPEAFPESEQIAFCIRECLDRKVPMKFTAGLHHPYRHYDLNLKSMMHGFVNVFGAGIIAMTHNISNDGLIEILNDERPGNFIFTENYFSWKDWKVETQDIVYARENLVTSFGSCSFDEPIEDLQTLHLL
ncbi:MAG: hypothetical protein ABI528_00495 [bacterium]